MDRHKKFQFGTNPMEMSPFEAALVQKEADDRRRAHDLFAVGIRGRDGGKCYDHHEDIEHFPLLKK